MNSKSSGKNVLVKEKHLQFSFFMRTSLSNAIQKAVLKIKIIN